ncbi:MAG: DHH family phosphoesterase, partial [Clostridia bacterium]|nr:DHH family phosphoesterase [Clostridia bacterium]
NVFSLLRSQPGYEELFVDPQEAEALVDKNTLLVVVDTHRPSMTENSELLSMAGEVVLIDHHRRGTEFIENAALVYHEPYASSTCEMVAELLQYMDNRVALTKQEAEAIYAGICLDTKQFTFKTGVRTFEAASFLRKQGVDTVSVKTVFQQDLTSYIKRAAIIKNAEIFREQIAISISPEFGQNMQVLIAQAADELLNIKGITASFVLFETESGVSISGRSLGGINVQVILEKLGGGGHMTIAGAQLAELAPEEAKEKLCQAIEEYYMETSD